MGILKVGVGALKSVLEDSWREYFYCPVMEPDVLVKKGENRKSNRSYNTKNSDNLISNGSIIAVNEGQCMMIVDQGAIVEVCAEAGEFVYDTSAEPSIFYGNLGKSIGDSFKQFGKRFTMGGDTARDQRVYFFNTKEIVGNKYGTANAVPFRVVDQNIGLDMDIAIRCHGEYSYRMVDPILFYKNICGNIEEDYTRDKIDSQLRSELLTALQPAFAKISGMGVRYSALPGHTVELANALREILSESWDDVYGITVSKIGVSSVKASEEDEAMIKELQKNAVFRNANMAAAHLVSAQAQAMQDAERNATFRNPGMAAAHLVSAQAEAMQSAAKNTSTGPMMAFAGMNMAAQNGGFNTQGLFNMAAGQGQQGNPAMADQAQQASGGPAKMAPLSGWTCSCGQEGNTGNFCSNCGKKKPEESGSWTCSCGQENTGNFCSNCGKKRPDAVWTCSCGQENKGNFCANCGKPRQ